jgi:hypothetical protein
MNRRSVHERPTRPASIQIATLGSAQPIAQVDLFLIIIRQADVREAA